MAGQSGRRGGRRERLQQRAAKPAVDPCPPGQIGGTYKPLTGGGIARIYCTALDLLETLGMAEVPPRLHADLLAAGARDNGAGRVSFPPSLVERAIDLAAKTFVLHGRDESRSIEVGGNRVFFGTGARPCRRLTWKVGSTGLPHWLICTISHDCRTLSPMSAGSPDAVWQPIYRTFSIWM